MDHSPSTSSNTVPKQTLAQPQLPPACQVCGKRPQIDKYGTLQVCGHFYGGGKNGRYYVFTNLEDVIKFEKGEDG